MSDPKDREQTGRDLDFSQSHDLPSNEAPSDGIGERGAQPSSRFHRFQRVAERVRGSKYYKARISPETPYGLFNGRPIIGERTKINGGIYLGIAAQEALVIDDKYPVLSGIFDSLAPCTQPRGELTISAEKDRLRDVFDIATSRLEYDPTATVELIHDHNLANDEKVIIDLFLDAKVGARRHRILLAAYLVERLQDAKLLSGIVWIDPRTTAPNGDDEKLIYTLTSGDLVTFLG